MESWGESLNPGCTELLVYYLPFDIYKQFFQRTAIELFLSSTSGYDGLLLKVAPSL